MSRSIAVVTGGAGFIGSHMVDVLLEAGLRVKVIDKVSGGREANLSHLEHLSELESYWMDILDLQPGHAAFTEADYVFHLAGIGELNRGR